MQIAYLHLDNEKELLGRDENHNLTLAQNIDQKGNVVSEYFIKISKKATNSIVFRFSPIYFISKHVVKQYGETSFAYIKNQHHLMLSMQPWKTTLEAMMVRKITFDQTSALHIINQLIEGFVELQRNKVFFDFDLSCVAVLSERRLEMAINPPCSLLLYEPSQQAYFKIYHSLTNSFRRDKFDLRNIFAAFCQILGLEKSSQTNLDSYEELMGTQLAIKVDENAFEFMKKLYTRSESALNQVVFMKLKEKKPDNLLRLQEINKTNNSETFLRIKKEKEPSIPIIEDHKKGHQHQHRYDPPKKNMVEDLKIDQKNIKIDENEQTEPTNANNKEGTKSSQVKDRVSLPGLQQSYIDQPKTLLQPSDEQQNGNLLIQRNASTAVQDSRMCITPNPINRDKYQKPQPEKQKFDLKKELDEKQTRYRTVDNSIT